MSIDITQSRFCVFIYLTNIKCMKANRRGSLVVVEGGCTTLCELSYIIKTLLVNDSEKCSSVSLNYPLEFYIINIVNVRVDNVGVYISSRMLD